jgi:hypothetical protein
MAGFLSGNPMSGQQRYFGGGAQTVTRAPGIDMGAGSQLEALMAQSLARKQAAEQDRLRWEKQRYQDDYRERRRLEQRADNKAGQAKRDMRGEEARNRQPEKYRNELVATGYGHQLVRSITPEYEAWYENKFGKPVSAGAAPGVGPGETPTYGHENYEMAKPEPFFSGTRTWMGDSGGGDSGDSGGASNAEKQVAYLQDLQASSDRLRQQSKEEEGG